MTMARAHLVDPVVTRWYHCITRCVRRAFLLTESPNRKDWIDQRLRELAEIFAVSVAGFAVLDNHLHVLVRLDPETVTGWSDEEVARRWGRLFPPRNRARQALPVSDDWVWQWLQEVGKDRKGQALQRRNDSHCGYTQKSSCDEALVLIGHLYSTKPGLIEGALPAENWSGPSLFRFLRLAFPGTGKTRKVIGPGVTAGSGLAGLAEELSGVLHARGNHRDWQ